MNLSFLVGNGIGPSTLAPVLFAVSTISLADISISLWSKVFNLILIVCVFFFLLSTRFFVSTVFLAFVVLAAVFLVTALVLADVDLATVFLVAVAFFFAT